MKVEIMLLGPPPVVTIIPTTPILIRGGVIQVIVVALTTVKDVAFNPPIVTAVASVKARPVIVTLVPPFVLPDGVKIFEILGVVI